MVRYYSTTVQSEINLYTAVIDIISHDVTHAFLNIITYSQSKTTSLQLC